MEMVSLSNLLVFPGYIVVFDYNDAVLSLTLPSYS